LAQMSSVWVLASSLSPIYKKNWLNLAGNMPVARLDLRF
jgi:hypothetical protein